MPEIIQSRISKYFYARCRIGTYTHIAARLVTSTTASGATLRGVVVTHANRIGRNIECDPAMSVTMPVTPGSQGEAMVLDERSINIQSLRSYARHLEELEAYRQQRRA